MCPAAAAARSVCSGVPRLFCRRACIQDATGRFDGQPAGRPDRGREIAMYPPTWSRATLSQIARLLSCFAVMPYLAFLAAFQALSYIGNITIPKRAKNGYLAALRAFMKMPGVGNTCTGQMLINSQQMCFVARVVHAVNVNAGRFSPGCPQSYDDTPRNAGDLVAAIIVQIPMPEALRN